MTSIIGVWALRSFEVKTASGTERPLGETPIELLMFAPPDGGAAYMGAQLTARPDDKAAETAPNISFSATYEVLDGSRYALTPTATNHPGKFPVGVTTDPKSYEVTGDGGVFTEWWTETAAGGKAASETRVVWDRLHKKGE